MSVVVQKYGGSSVATVEKIAEVADKVARTKREGHDVVVVVSAMGKTTDELLALAKRVTTDPPRRELDMLVSTGERVSMSLLSIAIQARGIDAISFTGSQSGILTNDRHFDARIIEVRPHRIQDELARGRVVIVAGYQGMSYKREITTLGRGGSDTTAVALAAALDADRCEIYSDVDGVYSADPRVVPDAQHLPELDLATLQEMAEAGAKVLNAQAVEWARRAKITILARRTSDDAGRETRVSEDVPRSRTERGSARGVVGFPRVVPIVSSSFERVLATLAEHGIAPLDVAMNGSEGRCLVALANVPDWSRVSEALARGGADILPEAALVSVVGDGLTSANGAIPSFLSALTAAGVAPSSLSASPLRISAVVPPSGREAAERALHRVFVAAG